MTTCKFCNNQIPEDQKFCNKCGAKIQENEPDTLLKLQEEEDVLSLGKPEIPEEENEQQVITEVQNEASKENLAQNKKSFFKKLSKKSKIIIAAAMAFIVTAGSVLPFVLPRKENYERPRLTFYIKGNALYVASLVDGRTRKITDLENGIIHPNSVYLNKNGTRAFYLTYPDNLSSSLINYTDLYYTDISFKEGIELKSAIIDTDVGNFKANTDGEKVVYIKSPGSQLFYGSVDSRIQIDSEVTSFIADPELSSIYYIKQNRDFCVYTQQSGKKTIDQSINDFYASEDGKSVYYIKDHYLFKYNNGKNILIDSDIDNIYYWTYSGNLYYIKNDSETIKYSDFIDDDKKDSDAALKAPVQPLVPVVSDYESEELFDEAYKNYETQYYNNYLPAQNEYNKKVFRDEIRQYCETSTYNYQVNSLYYVEGETAVKICNNLLFGGGFARSWLEYFSFTQLKQPQISKKSISSITNYGDLMQCISTYVNGTVAPCIAYKSSVAELPANTYSFNITFNPSKTALYFLSVPQGVIGTVSTSSNQNISGDLYKIEVNGNTLGSAQKIDSDVSSTDYTIFSIFFTSKSQKPVYFKLTKENNYDLFLDSEKIDNLKSPQKIYTTQNSDTIVYSSQATLFEDIHIYNGKTNNTIANNAHLVSVYDKDCIVYFQYDSENTEKKTKDLYLYNDEKEPILIDTNVDETIYFSVETIYSSWNY